MPSASVDGRFLGQSGHGLRMADVCFWTHSRPWTSVPFSWIAPTSMGGIATCGLIHYNIRPQLRTEQESEVPMHGSENNETAPPKKQQHPRTQSPSHPTTCAS